LIIFYPYPACFTARRPPRFFILRSEISVSQPPFLTFSPTETSVLPTDNARFNPFRRFLKICVFLCLLSHPAPASTHPPPSSALLHSIVILPRGPYLPPFFSFFLTPSESYACLDQAQFFPFKILIYCFASTRLHRRPSPVIHLPLIKTLFLWCNSVLCPSMAPSCELRHGRMTPLLFDPGPSCKSEPPLSHTCFLPCSQDFFPCFIFSSPVFCVASIQDPDDRRIGPPFFLGMFLH